MEQNGLPGREALDALSYRSGLERSLKKLSLEKVPLEVLLQDVAQYRQRYIDALLGEHVASSRFKSDDSIARKYGKTLGAGGGFRQCCNDILSFRLHLEDYPAEFPDHFRVVDLRKGKRTDDGYRAIHLYYQRDNYSYPIELQLWCGRDYWFNIWSHRYVYKYHPAQVGRVLHEAYCAGEITTEQEFQARLMQAVREHG